MAIALVPLKPFTNEKMPWCPCPSKNEPLYRPAFPPVCYFPVSLPDLCECLSGREGKVLFSDLVGSPIPPLLVITRAEQYVMNYLHLRHVPLLCVLFVYSYCSIQFLPPALDALFCVLLKSIRKKVALD